MNTIALFALYNNSSIFVYISTAVCTFDVLNQIVIASPPPSPPPTSGPGWGEGGGVISVPTNHGQSHSLFTVQV